MSKLEKDCSDAPVPPDLEDQLLEPAHIRHQHVHHGRDGQEGVLHYDRGHQIRILVSQRDSLLSSNKLTLAIISG